MVEELFKVSSQKYSISALFQVNQSCTDKKGKCRKNSKLKARYIYIFSFPVISRIWVQGIRAILSSSILRRATGWNLLQHDLSNLEHFCIVSEWMFEWLWEPVIVLWGSVWLNTKSIIDKWLIVFVCVIASVPSLCRLKLSESVCVCLCICLISF